MNLKKERILLLFIFFILIFSINAENKIHSLEIIIQPYDQSEFYIAAKKIIPKIIFKDKTIAKIIVNYKNINSILKIKKYGFKELNLNLSCITKKNNFFVLQKINSKYKTIKILNTGKQPKSVIFINNNIVAVPLLQDNGIDLINIKTGKTKRLSPPKQYSIKQGFVESLILKDKKELWISQMTTGCIHIFDLINFKYKSTIQSSGLWSKVMAYNPILNKVYLSNWVSHDISVINPDTKIEEKRIRLSVVPRGISFSKDGKFIYCAQFEDANGNSNCKIIKKKLENFTTIFEIGKPGAKRHIVSDYYNNRLYISDMSNSNIEVVSLMDDKLISTIKVFDKPNTIQLSPDGSLLFVSCRGPNNPNKGYLYKGLVLGQLYIIDTKLLKVIETIECGNQPTGLDVSPNGKKIVISDFLDNRIRVIESE